MTKHERVKTCGIEAHGSAQPFALISLIFYVCVCVFEPPAKTSASAASGRHLLLVRCRRLHLRTHQPPQRSRAPGNRSSTNSNISLVLCKYKTIKFGCDFDSPM